MARAYRFDRAPIGARPPQKRADGSVRFDATFTRSGVLEYRQADGTIRREYRSPAEVGRADSLASLELAHVVDGHPAKPGLAKGLSVGSVGDRIDFDGRYVKGACIVRDDATVAKIARGDAVELSPGYTVDLVEEAGISPEGEHYDALQTNIVYEHVALVERGRSGSSVRLRTDAADGWHADAAVQVDAEWPSVSVTVHSASLSCNDLERAVRDALASIDGVTIATPPKFDSVDAAIKPGMGWDQGFPSGRAAVRVTSREMALNDLTAKLKAALASIDVDVGNEPAPTEDAAASAARAAATATPPRTDRADGRKDDTMITQQQFDAEKARADAAEQKNATLIVEAASQKARADKAEAERDTAKDRADAAEQARKDAIDAAPGITRARLQLEATAQRFLGAEFKVDGVDDVTLQRAVVEKLRGKPLPADKVTNAVYVQSRFDSAIEDAGESSAADATLRVAAVDATRNRGDAVESEADIARKARERNANLSRNTQPGSN